MSEHALLEARALRLCASLVAAWEGPSGPARSAEIGRIVRAMKALFGPAGRCEHGVTDGEYCGACNAEYKRARAENGDD